MHSPAYKSESVSEIQKEHEKEGYCRTGKNVGLI
jgi:hypothetical protein